MVWRGPGFSGPVAPEPWPSRVEAFLTACAMHAGARERDLIEMISGLAQAAEQLGKK